MNVNLESKSNVELLSAVAGARQAESLAKRYSGLTDLAKASLNELSVVPGIGRGKAKATKSAFLLAQRLSAESYPEAPLIDTPEKVTDYLREPNRLYSGLYSVENFQVVLLNTRRRRLAVQNISQGTLDTLLARLSRFARIVKVGLGWSNQVRET